MRVDLNARVKTIDGEDAGTVERAVVDPETSEVTAFVVGTGGLLGRSVLVSREDLERASRDGDVLVLSLSKENLDDLNTYEPSAYGAPPYGWAPLPAYSYPIAGYLWPAGYAYMPPPPAPVAPASTEDAASDEAMTVDKGATVLDRDGEEVGVVDDVYFDPEGGRVRGVVVRLGGFIRTTLGGGQTVEIRGGMLDRVRGGVVYLKASKRELDLVA